MANYSTVNISSKSAVIKPQIIKKKKIRTATALSKMRIVRNSSKRILKLRDPELYSFGMAVRNAIEQKKNLGLPIARFDEQSGRAYLEYPDGRKEYVEA